MSYIWDKFNIKTVRAETIVFCDGKYQPELSTLDETFTISKNYDLPVHFIFIGKIAGEKTINIDITAENQPVFLSVNLENKFPAFFNIFVKNAGKNSEFRGHILLKNSSDLVFKVITEHSAPNNTAFVQTKVLGLKDSHSVIYGTAIVNKNAENAKSDIKLSGICDKTAKIRFVPAQKISSIPEVAEHSAYLFHETPAQENYLRISGLSESEVKNVLTEAFMNDFNLF